jgi:hypothetical protein
MGQVHVNVSYGYGVQAISVKSDQVKWKYETHVNPCHLVAKRISILIMMGI